MTSRRWQHSTPSSSSPSALPNIPILPPISDFFTGATRIARAAQTIGANAGRVVANTAVTAASSSPASASRGSGNGSGNDAFTAISNVVSPLLTLAGGRVPLPGGLPAIPTTVPTLLVDVARTVAPNVASILRAVLVRPELHGAAGVPPQAAGVSAPTQPLPSVATMTAATGATAVTAASQNGVNIGGTWSYTPVPLTPLQRSFLAMGSAALALANTYRGTRVIVPFSQPW